MNTPANLSPDHQLARAFHVGNLPAMRAWLAVGTSQDARNDLLDAALFGYRMTPSHASCSKHATAARLLVDAGATTEIPWIGATARFLADLRATRPAAKAASIEWRGRV